MSSSGHVKIARQPMSRDRGSLSNAGVVQPMTLAGAEQSGMTSEKPSLCCVFTPPCAFPSCSDWIGRTELQSGMLRGLWGTHGWE